ncbi:NUDIX hydrolase [Ktedonospora formicarum]|uniref:DNA mismatch repair protein MutT n=1 Tax=Ktedonospora formicarum TaxID=2778364 RepID=A0A8J3I688_9CHLR|nr:NUDIX domain-containing protein [Ktedonospora formicarum]GHO48166.1 DNA mismatch repair protein MutT [Ktedonospora formicarum]
MQGIIDKLALIYIVGGRILSTRSKGKDTYYLPGGKREGAETDQETLIREIKEELTVDILPETIEFVGQFEAQAHGKAEGMIVQMRCYSAQFSGELQAASEIEEVVWLSYTDRARTSPVDQIIFDYLKEKGLLV